VTSGNPSSCPSCLPGRRPWSCGHGRPGRGRRGSSSPSSLRRSRAAPPSRPPPHPANPRTATTLAVRRILLTVPIPILHPKLRPILIALLRIDAVAGRPGRPVTVEPCQGVFSEYGNGMFGDQRETDGSAQAATTAGTSCLPHGRSRMDAPPRGGVAVVRARNHRRSQQLGGESLSCRDLNRRSPGAMLREGTPRALQIICRRRL
jgi:hypothetical protein